MGQKNRILIIELAIVSMVSIVVIGFYHFLWPILLFVYAGYLPSKLEKK